jgi:hypothetical protein
MGNELVKASPVSVPATGNAPSLPELVERAGGAAHFAWEEFFYAEHHNPHTQRAYERAVRRFLGWADGQGVELAAITPGMVWQFLVGLDGSPAKRNQHLAALRGFFDGCHAGRQAGRSCRGHLGRAEREAGDGRRPAASQGRGERNCPATVERGTLRRPGRRIGQRGDATRAPTQGPRPERAARCRPTASRDWPESDKSIPSFCSYGLA